MGLSGHLRESRRMMLIVAAVIIGLFVLRRRRFRTFTAVMPQELIARGEVNPNDILDIEYERPDDVLF